MGIGAAQCQQIFMRAAFFHSAFFNDQDLIGRADGGKAVGDGDDGPLSGQIYQGQGERRENGQYIQAFIADRFSA